MSFLRISRAPGRAGLRFVLALFALAVVVLIFARMGLSLITTDASLDERTDWDFPAYPGATIIDSRQGGRWATPYQVAPFVKRHRLILNKTFTLDVGSPKKSDWEAIVKFYADHARSLGWNAGNGGLSGWPTTRYEHIGTHSFFRLDFNALPAYNRKAVMIEIVYFENDLAN